MFRQNIFDNIVDQNLKIANEEYIIKQSNERMRFEREKERIRKLIGDDVIDQIQNEIITILRDGHFIKHNTDSYTFEKIVNLPAVMIDSNDIPNEWTLQSLLSALIHIPGFDMTINFQNYADAVTKVSCCDTFFLSICFPLGIIKWCHDCRKYKLTQDAIQVKVSGVFTVSSRFLSVKQERLLMLQKSNSA